MENLILLVRSFNLNSLIVSWYGNVGEKLFDTVEDVVADGLITLFMEKHNADKYLQSQRNSLVTSAVGRTQPSNNGLFVANESTLTPIAEQDITCDDQQVNEPSLVANGYGVDPTATIVPHTLPTPDPLKSPDDESVVSDSQVHIVIIG